MADARNGELCALTANCHRDTERKPEPFRRSDFSLLATGREEAAVDEKVLSADETEEHLKSIFGA